MDEKTRNARLYEKEAIAENERLSKELEEALTALTAYKKDEAKILEAIADKYGVDVDISEAHTFIRVGADKQTELSNELYELRKQNARHTARLESKELVEEVAEAIRSVEEKCVQDVINEIPPKDRKPLRKTQAQAAIKTIIGK